MKSHTPLCDQLIGSAVNALNQARIDDMVVKLSHQDIAFVLAREQMQKVRDFIASPGNILGSMNTKHGEIAEQVEVGLRNSEQAIKEGLQDATTFRATFEGVGRNARMDYLIDGIEVQSKFINGTNKNLMQILKHMDEYSNFGKDGSFYHIPKDTWQEIQDVLDGKPVEGLKSTTIEAIKAKVAEIESETQRPFAEVVRPGISDYKDVQLGKINETLDKHDQELARQNDAKRTEIIDDH